MQLLPDGSIDWLGLLEGDDDIQVCVQINLLRWDSPLVAPVSYSVAEVDDKEEGNANICGQE